MNSAPPKGLFRMKTFFHDTFSSLKVRNYRFYFIGQAVSVSGTFMQGVAQAWLILKLTNSGTALGIVTALQYLPILLFGPWGGLIADRYNKRKVIYLTQTLFAVQAILLGILTLTGTVQVWMVGALAFFYGLVNLIDNPVRQTFVPEMVGKERVRNAVTLYSSLVNLARVIGPLVAALLIAQVGIGMCFIYNGLSYAAIILLLALMRTAELHHTPRAARAPGQISEGIRYILKTPILRNTLMMMVIIGTLTYEFQVSLPLFAQFTFRGNADTYAMMMTALGVGSIVGGILLAGQKKASVRTLRVAAFFFGLATVAASVMPTLRLALASIFAVGFFSILFQSIGNSILQLESEPHMRGRVMSYWTMAFLGSTTIGGPIIGWIGQVFSPRWSLAVGGSAAVIAAIVGALSIAEMEKRTTDRIVTAAELATDSNKK